MSEPPAKRRRVPREMRKRSERSCDQCRKRRGKCERSNDGAECIACLISKTPCTYEAPRKSRFQGSISDLSDRYRCLDAIVRAAFPGEAATTVPELLSLGSRHGFAMPNVSELPPLPIQELLGPEQPTQAEHAPATLLPMQEETDPTPVPTTSEGDSPGLVRDSSGQAHHIGPTGSLAFYASLRHLISSRIKCGGGDRRTSFAHDNAATTLESENGTDQENRQEIASPASIGMNERTLSKPNMREEEKRLPQTSKMNELMQAYFDNVHLDLPLFHRASFEEEYECFILAPRTGRSTASAYIPFPDSGWGWLACLHLILAFGSLTGKEPHSAASQALRRQSVVFVRSHLSTISTKSSLWNVRCLVLLSLYLHNNSERNAAYLVAGTAVRCSLALGLHKRDLDSSFRPIEREMRKRTFCSLYAYEQFLCSTLGRPSGMGDPDITVTPPKEGFLYNGNTVAELSAASVELQKILFKTRSATASQTDILEDLRTWKSKLPDFLDIPRCVSLQDVSIRCASASSQPSTNTLRTIMSHQPPPRVRSVLLLHVQYHYIAALITRAALLHSVASSHSPPMPMSPRLQETSVETADACAYHAAQTATLITLLHEFKLLRGESALDVFHGYSAGMLLILRLLQKARETSTVGLEREQQIKIFLRRTADRLRNAIRAIPKSPTMSRFASVLESFASLDTSGEDISTTMQEHEASPNLMVASINTSTNTVVPITTANNLVGSTTGIRDINIDSTVLGETFPHTSAPDRLPGLTPHNQVTFEELPYVPSDFSWSAFGNNLDLGWADFEGLLNGNGLFVP